MDFSKLLHGFVKIDTLISLSLPINTFVLSMGLATEKRKTDQNPRHLQRSPHVSFFFCNITTKMQLFMGPKSNRCLVLLLLQSLSAHFEFRQSCYMYFSKLFNGFVKIYTSIFLSCYMDLLKLLRGFVRVVMCISCPFSQTKP